MVEHGGDKPLAQTGVAGCGADIHAPQQRLVRPLRALLHGKSGHAGERAVMESAEDRRTAERCFEPRQRLRIFELERGTEGFGISLQRLQTEVPVKGDIRRLQAPDLRSGIIGHRLHLVLACVV